MAVIPAYRVSIFGKGRLDTDRFLDKFQEEQFGVTDTVTALSSSLDYTVGNLVLVTLRCHLDGGVHCLGDTFTRYVLGRIESLVEVDIDQIPQHTIYSKVSINEIESVKFQTFPFKKIKSQLGR